jgi:methyltransferase-like protein/2-polyprenyl-3-methyl-5-hydroxy-6-metoxy-1,4-benzoquinol methylase
VNPATSYDDVPYDSNPFAQTHPDRLATVATLLGLSPPPVERSRILELGCAAGGNLIPMAVGLPDSTFLGLDLSARQIEDGVRRIERLGLKNIALRQANILDLDAGLGLFDYIICHGVYSWVPPPVQEKILDICKTNLTPEGIAFVSYNTFPGWHFRSIIRDVMLYHCQRFDDPRAKVGQARALLDFMVASLANETTPYPLYLKSELELLRNHNDSYILHEHLEDCNTPVYFHQFVERVTAHRLRYLGEAEISAMVPSNFGPEAQQGLQRLSADLVQLEQFMDFLRNRTFRQTLLVHDQHTPVYHIDPKQATFFHITSPAVLAENPSDLRTTTPELYRGRNNVTLTTQDPLVKAAMRHLISVWPRTVLFSQLLAAVRRMLGRSSTDPAALALDEKSLGTSLLTFYTSAPASLVDFSVRPMLLPNAVPDRPLVTPLVRLQAETSRAVTNLRHEIVAVDDLSRVLLLLLDGTRNRAALQAALTSQVEQGAVTLSRDGQPITDREQLRALVAELLPPRLQELVRSALLVG